MDSSKGLLDLDLDLIRAAVKYYGGERGKYMSRRACGNCGGTQRYVRSLECVECVLKRKRAARARKKAENSELNHTQGIEL